MGPTSAANDHLRAWADSGAMSLCGRVGRPPLGPPEPLLGVLSDVATGIAHRSADLGRAISIDPLAVLTERAAISGLTRQGSTSCGGGSRLLPTTDGWIAVTLARRDDLDLLPAWLGVGDVSDPVEAWSLVGTAAAERTVADLVDGGVLLGLPVAGVGSVTPADGPAVRRTSLGPGPARDLHGLTVIDLSALWAGPLCGRILCDAGARVVKLESSSRPDGARRGPAEFFDLMNAGKQSVAVDFGTAEGRAALVSLLAGADVVIEASRPRALESLGIDARALAASGPSVWLSITAYGRARDGRNRVGFGDDTAAAGGAVAVDDDGPCFCGDALADPVTGMVSALAVLDALAEGGRWLLDVALARSAAAVSGPPMDVSGLDPLPPGLPPPRGHSAALGAHTEAVLRDLRS